MTLHIYHRRDSIGVMQAMVLLPAGDEPMRHLSSYQAAGVPATYELESSHELTIEQTDALIGVLQ